MKPILQHDSGNEFLNSQMLPPQARGANYEALYFRQLQLVTNQIHETVNIDQLMLEVSKDICQLFNADRLTLYALREDGRAIVSKVKTGLNTSQELKLPISPKSIAGFVAMDQKMVNISDVYDQAHLQKIHPQLSFLQAVDVRTGYLTKQMLVAPITHGGTLFGVLQVINNRSNQPFSKLDEDGAQYLCKTLGIAMRQRLQKTPDEQRRKTTKYDSLLTEGVLSPEDLATCIQQARDMHQPVEHLLMANYHVRASQIGEALSKFFRVPYEPFSSARTRSEMLQGTLKREFVEQQGWMPLEDSPDGLVIMCRDPEAIRGARVVPQVFPRTKKFVYCVTTQNEFEETLIQLFGAGHEGSTIDQLLADMDSPLERDSFEDPLLESAATDNELVKFVNKVIIDAFNMKASDIHIEPMPGKAKTGIRFRIDGSLQPYIEVPAQFRQTMVTRLKIMCDLDISEKRKPQDGKIKFKKFGPLDIELRVATIPSSGGVEDVVVRLLGTGEPLPLEKLGLTAYNLERLKKTVSKPHGLFYVCGPTGSGKTTTLHSILKYLNTPNTKIWTAEDPVEITQKGLRQVQINKKAGVDFAVIMRAFLRADPDIIMVGESRDKETVSMGVEASLTGHLVFSTLHQLSA